MKLYRLLDLNHTQLQVVYGPPDPSGFSGDYPVGNFLLALSIIIAGVLGGITIALIAVFKKKKSPKNINSEPQDLYGCPKTDENIDEK